MRTLELAQADGLLARYAEAAEQEPVIVTVKGTPIAVVLPVHNADVETVSLSLNPKFLAIIERSRRSYEREGGISSEEIRRYFGLPPAKEEKAKAKSPKQKVTNKKPKTKVNSRKSNGAGDGSQV
jgi:antitoxin (DNA-binding transcriptional repressor) of toxin-antitoxin stability system